MSLIGEKLQEVVRARYGSKRVRIANPPNPIVTFEAAHSKVGDLTILDDGDEATVYIGKITHLHFSCYDSGLSENERADQIVEDLTSFLDDLFRDQVLIWSSIDGRRDGCRTLSCQAIEPEPDAYNYLWSGPIGENKAG